MTKQELIHVVSKNTKYPQTQVGSILEGVIEGIIQTLQKGEYIQFLQFGKFSVKKRVARKQMNIKDRKLITIPERQAPVFTASKALKNKVNDALSKKNR